MLRAIVPEWPAHPLPDAPDGPTDAAGTTLVTSSWLAVGASRRGRLHAHRGDHREDAIGLRRTSTGWCGAVADGAGSAAFSRVGAAVATHTFCATFAAGTGPLRARASASAQATFAVLREIATRCDVAPRVLRTTLLVVAVDGDELLTMQVGDGGVVILADDGTASAPHVGDAGEFSGEVTHFLPDDGSLERLELSAHVSSCGDARAVLLTSDGIEDAWYPLIRRAPLLVSTLEHGVTDDVAADILSTAGVHMAFRGPVLHATDRAVALAQWMTFEKRGENDDRTLLVASQIRQP